ncbi:heparinase II/III family protein [Mollicutes bacterium LVI A0039]|nr:heparinase II/III family protein [Mollicutes bacterium LVI A0039]
MGNAKSYDRLIQDLYVKADIEKLLGNEFTFSRKYDMERCLEPVKMNPIDWNLIPFGDPEWTWVLHRMEYCFDLCVETDITKDLKYIEHAKYLIFDFIDNALCADAELRTLDTGIRIISWLKFYTKANKLGLLNTVEKRQFEEAIVYQVNDLYDRYRESDKVSNWGAIQCVGVLNALSVVSVEETVATFFINQFEKHLDIQYYNDGMQWEQSSVYIIEVCLKMLQMNNPQFQTEKYHKTLYRVFLALYGICDNNFESVALGDGDQINVEAVLQAISYVTKNPDLLGYLKSPQVYEEVYYLYGEDVITYFQKHRDLLDVNKEFIKLYPNTGMLSIKSTNRFLTFQNGPMGGGHGHADNLHVNLTINNTRLLIDSGRFSYVENAEYRQYLKSEYAHNGFIFPVDLVEYQNTWRSKSNFFYSPITYQRCDEFIYSESTVNSADNFGYRQIIGFNNGSTLILNSSFNSFETNYILDEQIKPIVQSEYIDLGEYKLYNFSDSLCLKPCLISKHYNDKASTTAVHLSSCQNQIISYFCDNDSSIEEVFDFSYVYSVEQNGVENTMRAFKLSSPTSDFTIFHLPFENAINNSAIKYRDKILVGKLIVINNQTAETIVLKN